MNFELLAGLPFFGKIKTFHMEAEPTDVNRGSWSLCISFSSLQEKEKAQPCS